jgi:shikimate dehydrogenase
VPEVPLQLGDLRTFPPEKVGLAVLGYPISHSISPSLHNSALRKLSESDERFLHWRYDKIEVQASELADALPRLAQLGYRGINLTIPHKVEALPLIDWIDDEAEAMGAVNTLAWDGTGWKGYNTDGYGLENAVSEALNASLTDSSILVLGAGGAARAATARCLLSGCEYVWVGNRSANRLKEMNDVLRERFGQDRLRPFVLSEIPEEVRGLKNLLIINATSLGLGEKDPSPMSLSGLSSSTKVYDMIYNPPETALLKEARMADMLGENGLSMLVHQAAKALEIWTNEQVCSDSMLARAREVMQSS